MLDICLLGTGGMMPMPQRWLTSMLARCEGVDLLIDCGEGTQIALKEKGWSPKPIDIMCFTHYHADHISGLPGMLLSMANAEKTTPLVMIGPKGLQGVVGALRVIAPGLPFDIKYVELDDLRKHMKLGPYEIDAFRLNHNTICYGYRIAIPRKGRFDAARAKELGIPLKFWNRLQHGETITETGDDGRGDGRGGSSGNSDGSGAGSGGSGRTYTPDMVMGESRRGLKVCYTTDTRPVPVISEYASDADLFICEGMYGEEGMDAKAREHKHMTMQEGARLAAAADPQPREMWFTHYSPSMMRPDMYIKDIRQIFPAAKAARDGWSIDLGYEDEGETS